MLSPLQGAVLACGKDPVAILFVRGNGPISRGKGAREMEHPAVSGLVIDAVSDGTGSCFEACPALTSWAKICRRCGGCCVEDAALSSPSEPGMFGVQPSRDGIPRALS